MKTTILSTQDLTAGYYVGKKKSPILERLNLTLNAGELVCLLGANGIGKSTLLRTLSGVQTPLEGKISIAGKDMSQCSARQLSRLISIVYTDRALAGALTVQEVVSLGRHPYTGFFGRLDIDDKTIVWQAMEAVGITHLAQKHIATLSDGERQKTMIARALAQQTPIIILDEPTAFLDVASRIETMQLLHSLALNQNKAILLSSHDISQSLVLAHRLWLLRNDRTMIDGMTEELIMKGELEHLFANREIIFDYNIGDFLAKPTIIHQVSLHCENNTLKHWLSNALLRNNIGIAENKEIIISATDINTIKISYQKGNYIVGGIEELIAQLEDIIG